MRPDWRALSLLLVAAAFWLALLRRGCDGGGPRPAELEPEAPGP
jgi:hypothetical protein